MDLLEESSFGDVEVGAARHWREDQYLDWY